MRAPRNSRAPGGGSYPLPGRHEFQCFHVHILLEVKPPDREFPLLRKQSLEALLIPK
jgi:hypothetical protein